MTWTYDETALGTSPKDEIRLLIGDTNPNEPLISDEAIAFLLTQEPGPYYAAAAACETIAGNYAREISRTIGPLNLNLASRQTQFEQLAERLRTRAPHRTGVAPIFFGDSYSDKQAAAQDPDLIGTAAKVGGMDNPLAGETPVWYEDEGLWY